MLAYIGLGLVVFAWAYLLFAVHKDRVTIDPVFVLCYAIGVLFLVIDGLRTEVTVLVYLNFASFICAMFVLYRLVAKR